MQKVALNPSNYCFERTGAVRSMYVPKGSVMIFDPTPNGLVLSLKGHVEPGACRLSSFLANASRSFTSNPM